MSFPTEIAIDINIQNNVVEIKRCLDRLIAIIPERSSLELNASRKALSRCKINLATVYRVLRGTMTVCKCGHAQSEHFMESTGCSIELCKCKEFIVHSHPHFPLKVCKCGHTEKEHWIVGGVDSEKMTCRKCKCNTFEEPAPVMCKCGHAKDEHYAGPFPGGCCKYSDCLCPKFNEPDPVPVIVQASTAMCKCGHSLSKHEIISSSSRLACRHSTDSLHMKEFCDCTDFQVADDPHCKCGHPLSEHDYSSMRHSKLRPCNANAMASPGSCGCTDFRERKYALETPIAPVDDYRTDLCKCGHMRIEHINRGSDKWGMCRQKTCNKCIGFQLMEKVEKADIAVMLDNLRRENDKKEKEAERKKSWHEGLREQERENRQANEIEELKRKLMRLPGANSEELDNLDIETLRKMVQGAETQARIHLSSRRPPIE